MDSIREERIKRGPAEVRCRENSSITATISFLTPIFGGGPESKMNDEVTPIRSASIKGQLRFWWRAARAGGKTLQEMKDEEVRLWGGPNIEGVISLSIDDGNIRGKEPIQFFEMNGRNPRPIRGKESLAYLGFSLQPTTEEVRNGLGPRPALKLSGNFTLTLHINTAHPDYKPGDRAEAEAALWAWRHFGGVGGRTRRGFGAVDLPDKESISDPTSWLHSPHIIDDIPPEGVPSLALCSGAAIVYQNQIRNAEAAWEDLAKKFKRFRQGVDVGRNPGQARNRPGRSRWPEPDVIRHNLSRRYQGDPKHKERITQPVKAPRGQFGMPIIFHFPQENNISDVTLKLRNAERYASPLILRPVGSPERSKAMVLLLGNRPDLDTLEGGCVMNEVYGISPYLTASEAHSIRPLVGETDPLLAFMNYFSTSK